MTTHHLRRLFLDFFRERGHACIPSSSLVPANDSSVLLTTAGMQQLKAHFLGERDPMADFGSRRLASAQRCFRTSDIESVGDLSHNTFFEMLGNFSVGDYFKAEAIAWAWEFVTDAVKIDPARLWATVFSGDEALPRDEEATALWRRYLPPERICANGRDDNFWGPPGDTGPCGPCSELHVDLTGQPCERGDDCRPNCACGRFLELWNLVFTELEKRTDGSYGPLAQKNIDTGMGLERLARVVQGTASIFDTDIFAKIFDALRQVDPLASAAPDERARRQRIIADHVRGATMLLADGVTFSNKDQGYILRRLVRRALDQCEVPDPALSVIVDAVIETYNGTMPWLRQQRDAILAALDAERAAYRRLQQIEVVDVLKKFRRSNAGTQPHDASPTTQDLSTDEAYHLVTTYGLSAAQLERKGYGFDPAALNQRLQEHQATSRAGATKRFGGHGLGHGVATEGYSPTDVWTVTRLHTATHLLHAALRAVLGPQVRQDGSAITPERLRFDFTFPRKLTTDERQQVEALINQKIDEDLPVRWRILPYRDALAEGALAFFKDAYGAEVKVYAIGDFSKELCGGPHVEHTAQVGPVRILSEKSSAAGIRRIKAVVENPRKPGLDSLSPSS